MGPGTIAHATAASSHVESRRVDGGQGARRPGSLRFDRLGVPATIEISETASRNVDTRVAIRGATRTISMLESADGAAEAVGEALRRGRELAAAAGNLELPTRIRQDLSGQFDALMKRVDRTARETAVAGQRVADGSDRIGMLGREPVALPPTDLRPEALGIRGVRIDSAWDAQEALARIDAAMAEVAAQQDEIGAAAWDVTAATGPDLPAMGNGGVHAARDAHALADRGTADDGDFLDGIEQAFHAAITDRAGRGALARVHSLDRGATLRVLSEGA